MSDPRRHFRLSISNGFSERTDIYGFGVFLLELISGREVVGRNGSEPGQNLVEWVLDFFPLSI